MALTRVKVRHKETMDGTLTINNEDTGYFAANISEMNSSDIAFRIQPTRTGQTKAIGMGAVGPGSSATGIQAYDTSDNSANDLLLQPLEGNVLKPSQPSFYAYPSGGTGTQTLTNNSAWQTMIFDSTGWNMGNHFSTTTYRFTAPVTGKYLMTWMFQLENNNNPTWVYFYPVVNGNRSVDRSRGVSFSDFMTSQYYHTENGAWIMNLSANDYVTMDAIGAGGVTKEFKAESHWSGYLLG